MPAKEVQNGSLLSHERWHHGFLENRLCAPDEYWFNLKQHLRGAGQY